MWVQFKAKKYFKLWIIWGRLFTFFDEFTKFQKVFLGKNRTTLSKILQGTLNRLNQFGQTGLTTAYKTDYRNVLGHDIS